MTLTRRKTLALFGGGLVLAPVVSIGGFVATRRPDEALKAWDLAGTYKDARLRALSFALLAPNPHNRQPWVVELKGSDGLVVYRDKTRNLPVTDPFDRQLTIGMGCFLELMDMAAAQEGYKVETVLFPKGEDGPVAVCRFVAGEAIREPLFAHTMMRRSHKEEFLPREVSKEVSKPLLAYGRVVLAGKDRDAVRRIARDAWLAEVNTPSAWRESIDLLRIGKTEINANPDGIDVGNAFVDAAYSLGLVDKKELYDVNNPNNRQPIDETTAAIEGAPAFVMVSTAGNKREDQIAAGRRWLRLNLAATGAGLALRPVSQALQEYKEVKPHRDEIHKRFAPDGATVQMLGLLGYGERTARTPRWPLESRLKNA